MATPSQSVQEANYRKAVRYFIWPVSIILFLVIVSLGKFKMYSSHPFFDGLPAFHSLVNCGTAMILIFALLAIRRKDIILHRRLMTTAVIFSIIFLCSYVLYHITHDDTRFGGQGSIRIFYFTILISHILGAAVGLPFILTTYARGYFGLYSKHKKLARWIFPLWLYICVTGPLVYLMLRPYYS